jgi:hypothetical protein
MLKPCFHHPQPCVLAYSASDGSRAPPLCSSTRLSGTRIVVSQLTGFGELRSHVSYMLAAVACLCSYTTSAFEYTSTTNAVNLGANAQTVSGGQKQCATQHRPTAVLCIRCFCDAYAVTWAYAVCGTVMSSLRMTARHGCRRMQSYIQLPSSVCIASPGADVSPQCDMTSGAAAAAALQSHFPSSTP